MIVATEQLYPIRPSFSVKDPYSALTHFIGILFSAILTPIVMTRAIYQQAENMAIVAVGIFMLSMILLYSASTIYHTFFISQRISRILKKIDHGMIFILIAGTYTPVCIIGLPNRLGRHLLWFVWGFAMIGIVFKLFWVTCPKWVSSMIYIGMGWSCIFALPALYHQIPFSAFFCLFGGGIVYTVGGVIYALKWQALNNRNPAFGSHEIFHLFVMLGNLLQFVCIWLVL